MTLGGAVVNRGTIAAPTTVTRKVTIVPALSRTKMLAVPAVNPVMVRFTPCKDTAATLLLSLVAVYGPVPPPTRYG